MERSDIRGDRAVGARVPGFPPAFAGVNPATN
jgi:hypothetical protein